MYAKKPKDSFQSTHPLRGATTRSSPVPSIRVISIHAPLAGCDCFLRLCSWTQSSFQSTHPLRGATCRPSHSQTPQWDFNPRTPCGVRRARTGRNRCTCRFQSTHPLRGATCRPSHSQTPQWDFNPRTPCGVRRIFPSSPPFSEPISIHAPLAGCDIHSSDYISEFQISIHAPLAGCD